MGQLTPKYNSPWRYLNPKGIHPGTNFTPKYYSPWRYLNPKGIHPGANFNPKSESPGWEFTMSHITPPPKLPMQSGGGWSRSLSHPPFKQTIVQFASTLYHLIMGSLLLRSIIWSQEVGSYTLSFDHGKFVTMHCDLGSRRVHHGQISETPIQVRYDASWRRVSSSPSWTYFRDANRSTLSHKHKHTVMSPFLPYHWIQDKNPKLPLFPHIENLRTATL